MKKSELRQLIKEEIEKLIEEKQYKLDSNLIKRLKDPIMRTWEYIGSDAQKLVKNNFEVIEMVIDANNISRVTKDKEAEDIITNMVSKYGYKKVLTFLSKNIALY